MNASGIYVRLPVKAAGILQQHITHESLPSFCICLPTAAKLGSVLGTGPASIPCVGLNPVCCWLDDHLGFVNYSVASNI
jgi:hypothetical protein